ncbi:molybdopterin binding aldehyde oxidase/xanthine dehydrogenase [Lineolata rhizophorae]|uniref:xanthine dehydrogenase n=1 Tax=Lineolata rhizophorae TaxID=578093 RepID=A0A6A6P8Q0_9PEZI|nr:molybdopterin binding aldehyde oxidase/xanthine dehydrogenase [Lineolata rhizophorae]
MELPRPPMSAPKAQPARTAADALTPLVGSTFTSSVLTFYLNGKQVSLENPNPHLTLLEYIRSQHGLRGTKLGCGEGGCGACTVVVQTRVAATRPSGTKVKHLAVNACLFPLVGVDGKHVITIEGLGNVSRPHPLQERIAKLHGSQCGFCTPGIVMAMYAILRNAYDAEKDVFRLLERDIQLEGHLDGNLCRCTGYKPILQAARTFVTEDLGGKLESTPESSDQNGLEKAALDAESLKAGSASCGRGSTGVSCGRPGGCCRDASPNSDSSGAPLSSSPDSASTNATSVSGNEVAEDPSVSGASYAKPAKSRESKPSEEGVEIEVKTETHLEAPPSSSKAGVAQQQFSTYDASTELIYPPALYKFKRTPICYGNERKLWFRPTTLQQLLEIKDKWPSAKLVAGATEVQVEIRFKNSDFAVSVYVSDIEELQKNDFLTDLESGGEIRIGANTPLTTAEDLCKETYRKFGTQVSVLDALRKQLRYFGGRQIRNVASLAGNLATASPISDANPVLLASGAYVVARNLQPEEIRIPLSDLFMAYRTTSLPPDAVITQVAIPIPAKNDKHIIKAYKQAKRKDDDIAIVNAAYKLRLSADGAVEDIILAYGGIAPTTVSMKKAKAVLQKKKWFDSETLSSGLDALAEDCNLSFSVPGGMAHYRRALVLSMFFRFWHESVAELQLGDVDLNIIEEIHRELSTGTRDDYNPNEQRVVGKQVPAVSALKQCTGEAEYVDDMPRQDRELFGGLVLSSKAHAKIVDVDWEPALNMPGVVGYIDKNSIPKEANVWGSVKKDEPFFADGEVTSHGQIIGMVYAETALQAQAAAKVVKVTYEVLPAILTIDEAIEANSFFAHGKMLKKGIAIHGNMEDAFARCDRVFEGVSRVGGQEHFYLETNASLVIPHSEDGAMDVWSSTQNTMETQEFVSQVTGVPSNRINARVKRMGGAFGGKESRSVPFACLLAVAAKKEGRPMRLMLNRDEDMMTSGQRHPIQTKWKIGTTNDGKLLALEADMYDNAGFSQDMSGAVLDRACTHLDNCYEIPDVFIRAHCCKTNTHSNTAFRGFGGPQAMFVTECFMSVIAEGLGVDIDELRQKNLYKVGDRTPFLQQIDVDWHIPTMMEQLRKSSDYDARKAAVAKFNDSNKWKKRGICLIPTKFGLSFATALHLNQATAYVKIYHDGSVLLHHGGTEMGQGLYTKMCQVAAQELGVPVDAVFTQDSQTYQSANASPTAASSGSDLNGMAVKDACNQINERLKPYREKYGADAPMRTLVHSAYLDRVNLAANGFWKMPRIGYQWGSYDEKTVRPMYYYFTQGVAVSEAELDLLTGDHTVLRTDILMDVGQSINPAIDYGQIEGAFVQGQGLFTMEESLWLNTGELATRGPGNYKIPGFNDIPQQFNVSMLRADSDGKPLTWNHLRSIQSSKGVGEPPLFLGATVFFALREAVKAARTMNGVQENESGFIMDSPATVERLRLAVGDDLVKKTEVLRKEGEKSFFVSVA